MNKNSYFKFLLFAVTIVLFASCDSDFNELGTDLVGIDNFNLNKDEYGVKTTSQFIGAVESNNLTINPLGVYDNPVFGLTKANFVTQVHLADVTKIIDLDYAPVIDSVILSVPYHNHLESSTYVLDSIYGPKTRSPFSLSVYESGYFIRDINPADQLAQSYYSDQNSDFDMVKVGSPLNDDTDATQNSQFIVRDKEINEKVVTKDKSGNVLTTANVKSAPALRLKLSNNYFNNKIFHAPAGKLVNNNVFSDYFRGLYFKVDKNGANDGNLAMLNFKGGKITIYYTQLESKPSTAHPNPDRDPASKSLGLNFTSDATTNAACKTVSLIEQAAMNVMPDSQKIVLKGGANSSMAIIDLFKKDDANGIDELRDLRNGNLLINDATLTFTIARGEGYMDEGGAKKAIEPNRVYLYDLTHNKALVDYDLDDSENTSKPKFGKTLFGGIIKKDSDGRGTTYKIRITKHVYRMVKLDSTNVRLGLVVTEDINNVIPKKIKTPALGGTIKTIPLMTTVHPFGTILYGSESPEIDKRPKFEIYYTKPKAN